VWSSSEKNTARPILTGETELSRLSMIVLARNDALPRPVPERTSAKRFPGRGQKKSVSERGQDRSQLAKLRDVFSPLKLLSQIEGKQKPTEDSEPVFTLSGTMRGGGDPVAIINSKFLHKGDRVGGFRVAKISKNQVLLRSGAKKIVLDVLKPTPGGANQQLSGPKNVEEPKPSGSKYEELLQEVLEQR
jgi:hypothetical protein